MKFTLHQLYVFGMVARHKSMTEAAQHLHMTQPAVSIQIKKLQEAVDIPLIEVVGRKLYLTEAGERLYEAYKNIDLELESFEAVTSQLKGGLKGSLNVSCASTAKYFLPYLLGEFQKRYPEVQISLKVTNRNEVIHHLSQNEYDLGILTQIPNDDSIDSIPFLENPLVMGAPPEHSLSGEKKVSTEQLTEEPFVFRELGSGTRMVMESYFKENGMNVSPIMELGMNEAVKQAIMAGIGLSLISKLSLENELNLNKISILNVPDFPMMTHWHMLYKKDKRLTPVTQNFISFLQENNIEKYLP
ncbi:DNA-binding transcriptional regulator, LysR family [Fodinibius salinus]|uniref:DNA-binding transcriptional regulator, LysR family n=1 Tax=Fodinibius salinus TaxID=860790 RepID=A0A5D3YJ25_9BACT|nr:LysR family transcriptional regulator [Fodinibius salinus]TYP92735.1 DNA-binding transcriptional regulator, LysR family [Fodinibius salinus]